MEQPFLITQKQCPNFPPITFWLLSINNQAVVSCLLLPVNHRWINKKQIYFIMNQEQCEKNDEKKENTDYKKEKNGL